MDDNGIRPGTLGPQQMQERFARFPDYEAGGQVPALAHASAVQALWGGKLTPIMAGAAVQGRFARAKLPAPDSACTGMLDLPAGARSMVYRNPGAFENILCLDGSLEIVYGPDLSLSMTLGRFDMLSIPADVRHSLHAKAGTAARAVMVLNIVEQGDYGAKFEAATVPEAVSKAALQALQLSIEPPSHDSGAAADLAARVARFATLVPYKSSLSATAGIPPEATEMLSAGSVFPLIVPEGHVGRSRTAPMYGPQGLYLSIAKCVGGDDGPPPHAHSDTQESFFVLDGEWEFATGFDRECSVQAEAYDVLAVPTRVMRAFKNKGNKPAHLFVIIQGPKKMNDTVSFASHIGDEVKRRFGQETIEAYSRIKMTFDAEERLSADA
ncbi:cupin domain-containing protein [Candidimonas nitroreducens]|uniref:Cupin type-2 domain-containing protein n=1 Tax=Candidimonas nitroreducens TaxID=683354 RepID=A0A225MU15_9BURK|nr:cupin domain-containing protein [Candidimonas nitroreducens]OWT63953.1 hypothetical protein CEY11_06545 [Candidimonas nitroreducens]